MPSSLPRSRRTTFARRFSALARGALFALVMVGVAHVCAAGAAESVAPDFAAVDDYVRKELEETRLPGASLGIVRGGEIVHLKGFGEAEDSGRKVTPQTPFLIGSNGKSFTALAVMQLVEDGKVELDAPVRRYLPWFRVADPAASRRITVKQLLNQTSGLPSAAGEGYLLVEDSGKDALEDEVRSMYQVKLTHPPGDTYQYCNLNYTTLGLIVQTVSGVSYEDYVEEHILVPLKMNNTYVFPKEAERHGLATGHQYWFGRPFSGGGLAYNRAATPAGLIASSAEDMSRYLVAQQSEGRYDGARILSADGIAQMHRGTADMGGGSSYAMGWVEGEREGVPTVWHEGSTGDFNANMILVQEGRWGIVLLTNGDDSLQEQRMDRIPVGVMTLLLERPPPPPPQEEIRTIFLVVLGMLVLQAVGFARSVTLLRRWRAQPERRPGGVVRIALRVVVPLSLNLFWASICLIFLPRLVGTLLRTLLYSDVGLVVVLSGTLALVWGVVLRPLLALLALRKDGSPGGVDTAQEAGAPGQV